MSKGPQPTRMGCYFCYFCHSLKRDYDPPWRWLKADAKADWNSHVLSEHNDLQWVEDNRESLVSS